MPDSLCSLPSLKGGVIEMPCQPGWLEKCRRAIRLSNVEGQHVLQIESGVIRRHEIRQCSLNHDVKQTFARMY